jgi:hypothetical protein
MCQREANEFFLFKYRDVEKKIGLEPIPVGDDRMERAKIHFPADCADERRLILVFYLRRSAIPIAIRDSGK